MDGQEVSDGQGYKNVHSNAMTTSGRPAYGNLAGHPFGVNAK